MPRGPVSDQGPMVRFFMNRGVNQGANPSRVLAAVCRRGEVKGTDVGSIAIHPNATTFDVSTRVAERFERLAGRRDPREPQTLIRRDRGPKPGSVKGRS
jgi:ATP-dependent RNA helicase DeaD